MPGDATTLAPERPRLAEALAAVTDMHPVAWASALRDGLLRIDMDEGVAGIAGTLKRTRLVITDPAEAWEVLATRGLVSDDPRRGFARNETALVRRMDAVCRRYRGEQATPDVLARLRAELRTEARYAYQSGDLAREPEVFVDWDGGSRVVYEIAPPDVGPPLVIAHPPTVAACVAFASDWPGVLAAEAIALESFPSVPRVVWSVASRADYQLAVLALDGGPIRAPHSWGRGLTDATGYVCAGVERRAVVLVCPEL